MFIDAASYSLHRTVRCAQQLKLGVGQTPKPLPFSDVSERFVQRVPRSLHAQLVARAKIEGVSLNTFVVSIVSQGLGQRQAELIKERSSKRLEGTAEKRCRSTVNH
jgi:hypothetical protein